jgi:16S rRNA A1518/A1519 N6-dimethyltransferase RsmA/KsgA/DIM1 with predicted DNA glycosylase/AP lyase activity
VAITEIERPYSALLERTYLEIVKSAFQHKRKKASRNLEGVLGKEFSFWENCFLKLELPKDVRPEDISTEQYKNLVQMVLEN